MTNSIRSPGGQHGVIVVHAFGRYREADFLDDPELIDRLVASGEGWRITDAIRLDGAPGGHDINRG
jgi:hypothetical protein